MFVPEMVVQDHQVAVVNVHLACQKVCWIVWIFVPPMVVPEAPHVKKLVVLMRDAPMDLLPQ